MTTKSIPFNVVLNDIEIIQNEINEFVSEIHKTKEGKLHSYEYLKNIYMFWKIKQLQDALNAKQDKEIIPPTNVKDVLQ